MGHLSRTYHTRDACAGVSARADEKNILAGNIKDWKNDLESAAKSFVSETNRRGYVTETGKIEDWSKENKTEIEKTVNETISGISKKLTSQLEKLNNNN